MTVMAGGLTLQPTKQSKIRRKEGSMNEFPLLFTIREIVPGGDFVAGVVCDGRALIVKADDGGWHCSGVEPGALSELGETEYEAYHFFRQAFSDSLRVLAADSADFADFERRLTQFFGAKDVEDEQRWNAAREALREILRSGKEPDGPFRELPKKTVDMPRSIKTWRMDYRPAEQDRHRESAQKIAAANDQVGLPLERVA